MFTLSIFGCLFISRGYFRRDFIRIMNQSTSIIFNVYAIRVTLIIKHQTGELKI